MSEPTQLTLFDYDSLDTETRVIVQQRTGEIKKLVRQTAEGIIEIGEKLAEVRDRLAHNKAGGFEQWLRHEFDWSKSTAYNFINVFEHFGNLPNFGQLNLAPSVLYQLASPSTPHEARQEALARAEAGEPITGSRAKEIIIDHKQAAAESEPVSVDDDQEWLTPTGPTDEVPETVPNWLETDSASQSSTMPLPPQSAPPAVSPPPPPVQPKTEPATEEKAEPSPPPSNPATSGSVEGPPPPPPPKPKPAPPPPDWHLHATIKHTGRVLLTLAQVGQPAAANLTIEFPHLLAQIEQALTEHIPSTQLEKLRAIAEIQEA